MSVRPLIAYIESEIITRGMKLWAVEVALMMVTISPTWFDCASPGTRNAPFLASFGVNQIPLPQLAFLFPLCRQAPSVYMVSGR
jgi:hypothetical protein